MKDDYTVAGCHPRDRGIVRARPGRSRPAHFLVHPALSQCSVRWAMVPAESRAIRKLGCSGVKLPKTPDSRKCARGPEVAFWEMTTSARSKQIRMDTYSFRGPQSPRVCRRAITEPPLIEKPPQPAPAVQRRPCASRRRRAGARRSRRGRAASPPFGRGSSARASRAIRGRQCS
jgi:hypothetical protein